MCRWSYGIHLTYIGNAVYVSMDIPDTFLAVREMTQFGLFRLAIYIRFLQFSKLLNYLKFDRAKMVSFGIFILIWTCVPLIDVYNDRA